MELKTLTPRKSLHKAFLKIKPIRVDIESFKINLTQLINRTNNLESEEFHKNLIIDFLKKTYYDPKYFVNTKGRNDLVIHKQDESKSSVAVIIEAKKPSNKTEMPTKEKINVKAFQELILYYLRERISKKNLEIKHLMVTNVNTWFIFDSAVFEKLFAQDRQLIQQFNDFENGHLAGKTTSFFYKEIAEPFVANLKQDIEFTYLDLRDYKKLLSENKPHDDPKRIALFKLFSPQHLLKLPFINDSNSLNEQFYEELLYIIGLTEVKKGGKKVLERYKENKRQTGALLENTILQLYGLEKINQLPQVQQFGKTQEEQLFNVGLELSITWINRILFLKLLEAQLLNYHKGDRAFAFLNLDKIYNYGDLNNLFFKVLARKQSERSGDLNVIFQKIPYLNSSLFEPTSIEHTTLVVSNLEDQKSIPIFNSTVLKDEKGRKKTGSLNTLAYLFDFLNAYDFSSEGLETIQEERKTLINASVLGLIFEKINGYKEGSFFTPGFITMYMCQESIRKAIVQKFNEKKGWNCKNIDDVYDKIEDRKEANQIINSLKICDPAVGSGHFLVSALNELIAIKNDLNILEDRNNRRLKEYDVKIVNDELIVTDENGEIFHYHPNSKESQRVQEALFHEKQTLIENCLFGVDINSNSVNICRLRLWIELLKHAYYKNKSELETLPNIDINIKTGNSLISKLHIDDKMNRFTPSQRHKVRRIIPDYKRQVELYKSTKDKESKNIIHKKLNEFWIFFDSLYNPNDALYITIEKKEKEWEQIFEGNGISNDISKEEERLRLEIEKLKKERESKMEIYIKAFEWRFAFPEVLDEQGNFIGFDVVIGNPPYIRQEYFSDLKVYLNDNYQIYHPIADLLTYFIERSYNILKINGLFKFIISNKFTKSNYGEIIRYFLSKNTKLTHYIDFTGIPVFDKATVDTSILGFEKKSSKDTILIYAKVNKHKLNRLKFQPYLKSISQSFPQKKLSDKAWIFQNQKVLNIKQKIEIQGVPLKDWSITINSGIKTGFNKAFIIDQAKRDELIAADLKSADIIKPILRGRDIKKYQTKWAKLYLITTFPPLKIDINNYPAVKKYLKSFGNRLKQLGQDYIDSKGKQKSRKKTGNKWFEMQDQIAYYKDFEKEKIAWAEMTLNNNFVWDTGNTLYNQTCYFIPNGSKYLLAVLNSKVIYFYMSLTAATLGTGALRWIKQYVENLPIPQLSKPKQKPFENLVNNVLEAKIANKDTSKIESEIDRLVYDLYGLNAEEIALVEKS